MIYIDYQDRTPIYEQLVSRFQMLIIKGILPPDSQMPSVRKLATELSINPNTIQKAYMLLEQEGYIYPVKGKGNFVSPNPQQGLERKRKEFFQELKGTVRYAQELKISREDFIKQIDKLYAQESMNKEGES